MCVHTANVHQHGSLCVCVSVCVCFFVSIFSACLCVSPKSECVGRHLLILDNRKQDVYSVLDRDRSVYAKERLLVFLRNG